MPRFAIQGFHFGEEGKIRDDNKRRKPVSPTHLEERRVVEPNNRLKNGAQSPQRLRILQILAIAEHLQQPPSVLAVLCDTSPIARPPVRQAPRSIARIIDAHRHVIAKRQI